MGLNKFKINEWDQKQKKKFIARKLTTSQQWRTFKAKADDQKQTDNLQ